MNDVQLAFMAIQTQLLMLIAKKPNGEFTPEYIKEMNALLDSAGKLVSFHNDLLNKKIDLMEAKSKVTV